MPTYKLTLWGTQVLRDEDTYYVIADTKEQAAAALLSKLSKHLHRERDEFVILPVGLH